MSVIRSAGARIARIFGPDQRAVVQSVLALLVSLVVTLVAGLLLANSQVRLEELPGLLLLVPAAIGQRGNIFGGLGSRLGTAIHTGEFTLTRRIDTILGQNMIASLALLSLIHI